MQWEAYYITRLAPELKLKLHFIFATRSHCELMCECKKGCAAGAAGPPFSRLLSHSFALHTHILSSYIEFAQANYYFL
jgi:hypothetical protein